MILLTSLQNPRLDRQIPHCHFGGDETSSSNNHLTSSSLQLVSLVNGNESDHQSAIMSINLGDTRENRGQAFVFGQL